MSAAKKHYRRRGEATFVLQITAMVDMLMIILVFLIKSYSTNPYEITPTDSLKLPASTSTLEPEEYLKLVVSKEGVFVEDEKIVDIFDLRLDQKSIDTNDTEFVRPLFEALDKHAEKGRSIATVNEAFEFEGKVVVQADRDLPYSLLKKIMYTSTLAGYANVKLAVLRLE
ncbi:MAG: hypothetical protein COT74_06585 [Bdellovibrionales bacterium CG10_big_fil_rev_8_21_14_0_10_45_34]|nr:MAG: hypothetical protein COT74_06585 [Bdellovibrionales bacterium CG10_big_fil_rev_8_21_14_0_10_45_34]